MIEDYLWEIGSGSNWLSYHLSVAVALHEFFLQLPQGPVPSFLVVDQPSQVYFPSNWRPLQRPVTQSHTKTKMWWPSAKIFAMLADAVPKRAGRLQIIVLDHAYRYGVGWRQAGSTWPLVALRCEARALMIGRPRACNGGFARLSRPARANDCARAGERVVVHSERVSHRSRDGR